MCLCRLTGSGPQAVWESGTLPKVGAKREYANLFKEDNLIARRSISKHRGDLYLKLTDSAIELKSASVAYVSVLKFKRCYYVADIVEHLSQIPVAFLFRCA